MYDCSLSKFLLRQFLPEAGKVKGTIESACSEKDESKHLLNPLEHFSSLVLILLFMWVVRG